MNIGISRIHFPVTALGPGRRIGIWFQGCSIRCPGCISLDTWTFRTSELSVADVVAAVLPWLCEADGITISGGEPFDQSAALRALLLELKKITGIDVLVFSGYAMSHLAEPLASMEGLIDALVSEPFDRRSTQDLPLRGSDNQILHRLTDLGQLRFGEEYDSNSNAKRELDIMIDESGDVWMAGIPRRGDLDALLNTMHQQGFLAQSTEQKFAGDQEWK